MYRILILPFCMCLLLVSCKHKPGEKEPVSKTFVLSDTMMKSISIEPAVMQQVENELKFYGKITTDNNKLIEVFPIVGGNVEKVNVELGDYVKKGQVLATIRSTEVAGFERDLVDARNNLVVAKNNLRVAQELFDGKLNTEREVAEAQSQYQKAQSELGRMEETYRIYHLKNGSLFEVRSPLSGFVIQKNINQDMQLRSDRTDNIFDIAQIDDVWAIANVNESDIDRVRLGVDAYVTTLSYGEQQFKGKVDKIYNIIDPETKAMKVRVKLSNEGYLLKPEMRAWIVLRFFDKESMVRVPSSAVIFDKSKSYVMLFKDRYNVETRQVEVYRQVGNNIYISSGLKESEKVITKNQLLIYNALNY
ncbi:MAG: efflux RND transporter periplasmic adaptor subunit [Chitinophagaceae bacterium]|nr:efflux RND transporter periplasmic adaptor subunit [Chitinophagaceae bacterium]